MNRLGRYELLEKLGEGGMGAVWLGRLTGEGGFEKLCILKTVLPSIASDAQFVSRFLHEGRVLTQLQHANIAQVFDMGREGDTLYLALEYVPGVDLARLHQHVREAGQTFPVPAALYLVQQMAEGLGFAHRKRATDGSPLHIVHRDVSPQNVMVSYDGEVKVIDFGIAKSQARSHATASASVMGKLGYMAPEQARGEPVDARADQYAAAVVLWEALANESFIPRGTMTEMVVAMANPKARPLTPLRSDVPASLEAVILKALSASPDARYATTDDFASALMNELLRLSGLPTKLQVGEWVRATCPKEFTANQALLTRVSTTKPTEVPMDRTLVRTPTVAPGPSTADVAALAVPRSKLPIAALAIGGVLVLGAALAWFGLRSEAPSQVPLPPPVAQPVVPSPPPPPLIAAPRVAEVFTDKGATFVRAGRSDG
ncbi:MAG: serine/threonine protein kinase, partial [Archangium sp.]|nr:serine/threonine protein kinase [Archangium sp.]